jgi:phosphoserine phosphatase
MSAAREIVALVTELERLLVAAEDLLVKRDWPALERSVVDQRRVTHALEKAMEATAGERPADFERELRMRIARIARRRADQLRRLEAFRDAVGSRLATMAKAKAMRRAARPLGGPAPALINALR